MKYHEEVLSLQSKFQLNVLTFFPPPAGGCSDDLDAFKFSFKYLTANISVALKMLTVR